MLEYTSQTFLEAMAMPVAVSYTPYDPYPKEQTDDIIMFAQFEGGDLLSETHDDAKNGDKSDDDSIMPPLISKEEMDSMDSGYGSEDEPMSTDMLEDFRDSIQSHPSVNRREAHYKIRNHIKPRQS